MIAASLACAALFLAGCDANDDPADERVPEGRYPLTFSTSVEELHVSRAAGAEGVWTADDVVAVKDNNSGEVKKYVTDDFGTNTARFSGMDDENTFFWESRTDEEKEIEAWWTGTGFTDVKPGLWTVQTDQRTDGYRQSDFRATPGLSVAYPANSPMLKFYHQTAKVVVRILNAEDATDADLVTDVRLLNMFTKANCHNYKVSINEANISEWNSHSDAAEIIPHPADTGGDPTILKSYAALVIPQDMTGKPFIRVTIDGREYVYTPKEGEGELLGGTQYTYTVTVKGGGLEVTTGSSGSWNDTPLNDPAEDATTFRMRLTGSELPALSDLNGIAATADPDIYEITDPASFSFSIPKAGRNGFLHRGYAYVSQTETEGRITYTYTDIRSDLRLDYGECPQVGDYYYADGTWSAEYTPGEPACIGIVFKVGAGPGDHATRYDGRLTDDIRGYAVALQNAGSECEWGAIDIDTPLENISDRNHPNYDGYVNTKTIVDTYKSTQYWVSFAAFRGVLDYQQAPDRSSGWYLPSLSQLTDICNLHKSDTSGSPGILKTRLAAAGGDLMDGKYFLTSTEQDLHSIWIIEADNGQKYMGNKDATHYVTRAVLTF